MNNGMLGMPGSELLGLPQPQGAGFFISMWSGATTSIPLGWQLCDGTNGVPDLRDKFIMGAGSTYNPGDTGGSATFNYTPTGTNSAPTFTGSAMAGHTHDVSGTTSSDGAHTHTFTTGNNSANVGVRDDAPGIDVAADPHTHSGTTDSSGAHTHTFADTSTSDSAGTPAGTVSAPTFTGDADVIDTVPPYFALCFIAYMGIGQA